MLDIHKRYNTQRKEQRQPHQASEHGEGTGGGSRVTLCVSCISAL